MTVQGTAADGANVLVESANESGPLAIVAARPGTGNYWSGEAMEVNGNGPAYGSVNVIAALVGGGPGGSDLMTSAQKHAFLPASPQSYSYDADGNLSSDGVWNYTYDAENRLIQMTPVTAVVNLTGYGAKQLKFKYDYLGRRVDKQVYTYNGGWMLQSETKFVYAGWNLLAETDAAGNLQRTYAWGVDVAGSLTATGGIGALAEIVDHVGGAAYLPAYDGSGNVAALISATDGSVAASYEYTPYGQLLREEGAFASVNPFRFSTHYWDEETGDVYYGYRYYSPVLGRFLNRDPLGEQGGLNLYGFVQNDPINSYYILGMDRNEAPLYKNANGTWVWGETDGPTMESIHDTLVAWASQLDGVSPRYNDIAEAFAQQTKDIEAWSKIHPSPAPTWFGLPNVSITLGPLITVDKPSPPKDSSDLGSSNDPNSLARDGGAGTGTLPTLSQSQIDGVWNAWGSRVKLNSPRASDSAALKEIFAQAVLYRRPNGAQAIAMQQVIQGMLSPENDGRMISLGFGAGNETRIINGGEIHITIEPSNQAQMVVSIMHELLHAVDYQTLHGLDSLLISSDARHDEIYRLQNQTLYELTGTVDRSYGTHTIPNPMQYVNLNP